MFCLDFQPLFFFMPNFFHLHDIKEGLCGLEDVTRASNTMTSEWVFQFCVNFPIRLIYFIPGDYIYYRSVISQHDYFHDTIVFFVFFYSFYYLFLKKCILDVNGQVCDNLSPKYLHFHALYSRHLWCTEAFIPHVLHHLIIFLS